MRTRLLIATLLTALITVSCFADEAKQTIQPSTKSTDAAKFYEQGMKLQENLRTSESLALMKEAVKADPSFALAWAMRSTVEVSPEAAARARKRASALMAKANEGEQMLIRWIVARGESDRIAAISASNDLVAKFPNDARVLSMVGNWMTQQGQWDRDVQLQERVIELDPKFASALNELGYAYAHQRRFDKAVETMNRYVALVPNEPNPQDSMGEILRLAGKYEDAIGRYKNALKIMPDFYSSQQGIGDTYALMGDQKRAREEYAKCSQVKDGNFHILCQQMSAYSYIREQNMEEARKQLTAFAANMSKEGQTVYQAEALMALAFIGSKPEFSYNYLDQATRALKANKSVTKSDRDEISARILAHKIRIAALAGDMAEANQALGELELAAKASMDPMIQAALKGGRGAALFGEKKYSDAITELQDDGDNAFSQMLLVKAYRATGKDKEADELKDSMLTLRRLEIDLWMAQQQVKS